MAGRRLHRSGMRARTAKQRAQLVKAQQASARKRTRNKRVLIGLASGVVAGGAAYGGVKATPRVRAKARAYPYAKMNMRDWENGDKLSDTHKRAKFEGKQRRREISRLKNRKELVARNKARRQTPEQRAASRKRRSDYLQAYNDRRRAQYQANDSVSLGRRPRKKRAKETKPRKRKTD